ncbi:MAG TPA: tRNA lysidine(34) synthetase TilS [Allosphingosinicella sp.]|nr:tRNA lysidine(34) synthetase TilS [Allosphingosinicella sp.]
MPTPDRIDRFRRDLLALADADRLAVAVSGGPDSLALLLLAHAALTGRVEAATVDHRLRPENADEAAHAASICARLGIPHAILSDPDAPISGASRQAQARALRYRLLATWAAGRGIRFLATGHHADDQAETVLMRLARGAGLGGLAGVRARRHEGAVRILRPLLGWRRAELAAIVADAGLVPVDDPSNRSEAYDRTRFRALLAGTDLLPPERLAAAAAHLAEAEQALAWAEEREWAARAGREGDTLTLDPAGLPPEILRRLAARAVSEVRGDADWRSDKLAPLLSAVAAGGTVNLAGIRIVGAAAWRFSPEPPRRSG